MILIQSKKFTKNVFESLLKPASSLAFQRKRELLTSSRVRLQWLGQLML